MLGELITSKTRLRLMLKFFISQANRGYLNGLATEMNESTNAIRKELNHLHGAGYLEKVKIDNKVEYRANIKHPLFNVLRKVVLKHLGLEVFNGLARSDTGRSLAAGIGICLLAMIIDRISLAWTKKQRDALGI